MMFHCGPPFCAAVAMVWGSDSMISLGPGASIRIDLTSIQFPSPATVVNVGAFIGRVSMSLQHVGIGHFWNFSFLFMSPGCKTLDVVDAGSWKFCPLTTWIGLSYFFVLDPYKPSICHWVLRGVDLTLKLSTKMENDYPKVLFNCRKTTLKHHWIGTTSEDGDTVDKSGRCHGVSTGWRKSNYDYYYLYCSNWYRDWELFEGFAAECFLNENILCHWWSETLGHQKSLSQAATESVLRWSEILKLFVHVLLFLYFTLRIMSMHEIG